VRSFAVALACFPLFACPPSFPSEPAIPDRLCAAICARHVACQPSKWNEDPCRAECESEHGPASKHGGSSRKYWRADYVDSIVKCTEAASCDLAENDDRYVLQCFDDTLPPPSELARRVCGLRLEKYNQCRGEAPRSTCAEEMNRYSDAVLESAARCLSDNGCDWGIECWNDWVKTTM
jgi:hypothetical protein